MDRQCIGPLHAPRTTYTSLIATAPPFTASPISIHSMKSDRDIEKTYPVEDFIAKLRRLADCLESGEQFEIQIAGERIYVPVRAVYSIEHEREDGSQEIEFQIKWDT
jgi:amphi-Trp domain-containing protein